MRAKVFGLVVLAFCLSSCSSLVIRDRDTAGAVAGKVVARTLLAVPTLLISEIKIGQLKQWEEVQAYCSSMGDQARAGSMTMAEAEMLCAVRRGQVDANQRAQAAILANGFQQAGQSFQQQQQRRPITCTTFGNVTNCY